MNNGIMQSIVGIGIFHPSYFYIALLAVGFLFMLVARKLLKLGLKASVGLGVTAIIAIFAIIFFWVGARIPGSDDRKHAEAMVQAVVSKYPRLKNGNFDEGLAIYTRPHPGRIEIYVYGVITALEQDKVISIIRSLAPNTPVILIFYQREKFIELRNSDGSISRKRIEQEPLREEQITAR